MSETRSPIKAGYHGYPEARQGPDTGYTYVASSNPVLRGIPLTIAGAACVKYVCRHQYRMHPNEIAV